MHRSPHPVQVATAAPLLRVVLILLLMVAALAGVLVVASPQIGWLTLGFAVVAGPVAVMVEGRNRRPAQDGALPRRNPEPTHGTAMRTVPVRWEAA